MVLEIIHVVLMFAMLACGLVLIWYAQKIHASHARRLTFLDAQDLDHRRNLSDARKLRDAWHKEISNSLRDTRAILGKLYSIAAESSPSERETHLMPPTAPPALGVPKPSMDAAEPEGDRLSDSDAETQCLDKGLVLAVPKGRACEGSGIINAN